MTNEKPPETDRTDGDPDRSLVPASAKPDKDDCSPEALDAVRKEFERDLENVVVRVVETHMWQGPLPSPDVFSQYPDPVQRHILDSSKEEAGHRRRITSRGQIIAAALGFAAIGGAIVCALNGQPWVGGVIAASFAIAIGIPVAINLFGR